ncbi:aldose epimerase family protein [Sporolactobacillus laevolacticus]|uniref:Aldose 1-epimerase n=1 Tax=Sporolactobacillus laevolacticus DSM 442 TaxID=1395513 RepID=V6J226_9BACL|nr:aldose epimerase family protein [Sporolactobacillus laevolacticus]EST10809.1 aldose 1-epimerase [Sporolactobacillus laevolacticus DSM 442]
MEVSKTEFGLFHNQTIWQYTLANDNGLKLNVMNYGATLTDIEMPDKHGKIAHIVIGSGRFQDYLEEDAYFGATVGRVAGRITAGKFSIDGANYQLPLNDGNNTNHGGPNSFERLIWESHPFKKAEQVGVRFDLFSPDGTNGFPGNLNASVTYSLNQKNEWQLHYEATTDKPTLFNPTNHVYFNLSGELERTVDNHLLQLASHRFGEIHEDGTPTGRLIDITGTPFNFIKSTAIKNGFDSDHPQNKLVTGYDHPFFLDKRGDGPNAILEEPLSGRRVTMSTTNNAVVVYSGNALSDKIIMDGKPLKPHCGITLEAQMMPDAIHHEGFGNIILRPGTMYEADTVYHFECVHD